MASVDSIATILHSLQLAIYYAVISRFRIDYDLLLLLHSLSSCTYDRVS